MNTGDKILVSVAVVIGLSAVGFAGYEVGANQQREADHKMTAQVATDAFVRGACGGASAKCQRTITASSSEGPMAYAIALGNVYKQDDLNSGDKPVPLKLPSSCTTFDDAGPDDSGGCEVKQEVVATDSSTGNNSSVSN